MRRVLLALTLLSACSCHQILGDFVDFDDVHEGDEQHTVTIGDAKYVGPIKFKKLLPNGEGCPPRCYQAEMTLTNGVLAVKS
jgi:hypothetical protein